MAVVLTEVHAEVGEVFENDDVVFISEFADDLELFVCQAHPCRVVRIRIQHAVNLACLEDALEFLAKLLATVVVDVELLHRDAENLALEFMHREAWVDEQHRVLFFIEMTSDHEGCESALHRTHCRDAVGWCHVEVEEVLDET